MPEPPGRHFIVRKKQGDNIIHVGRAVAAQNPLPEFFPGEHLEYGVITCGPGFRFPVARRNGLGAAQPVVVEFFRGEGDAAAAGDGPGNVKGVFSAGEGRRQADFQGGGTAGEEPPEQFAPDDAGDPVFQKEPEYFSFLRKDAVAGGVFNMKEFFLSHSARFSAFSRKEGGIGTLDHVRPAFFREPVEPFVHVRLNVVIRIRKTQVRRRSSPDSRITGFRPAGIFLCNQAETTVSGSIFPDDASGPVG